jgi:hypothetical protein
MKTAASMNVAAVVYALLALLVLLLLFRGIVRMVRVIGRGLGREGTLLAGDLKIKLLGLATAAILFTPLLNKLARALLSLAVLLMDRVPREMLAHWQRQATLCDPTDAVRCAGETLLVLVRATGAGIASALWGWATWCSRWRCGWEPHTC